MKKRFLSIFLIIILAVTNLTVSYASGLDTLTGININNYQNTIDSEFSKYNNEDVEVEEFVEKNQSFAGIIRVVMNLLATIIGFIVDLIILIIGLIVPTMDALVFNDAISGNYWGRFVRLSYFDPNPDGLAGNLVGTVSAFYQTFRYVALIFFVIAIALISVKMILASVGKQKQKYKEDLKHWIIGLMILVVGHWIMIYAIYFSDYLVELIVSLKDSLLENTGWGLIRPTLSTYFANAVGAAIGGNTIDNAVGAGAGAIAFHWIKKLITTLTKLKAVAFVGIVLGVLVLIAIIAYVVMNLKLFKVYLERVIIVGVLIMIFPLAAVFYAFEKAGLKKGSTFDSWLKAFFEQVYIQPVHAISLLFVMVALDAVARLGIIHIPIMGLVVVIMILNTVFEIENVVKRVISVGGAKLSQPANLMSAAGTVGMAINAGLSAKNLRTAIKAIHIPTEDEMKNDPKCMTDGEFDEGKFKKVVDAAKAGRSALLQGTIKEWTYGALGKSPLHLDSKLFHSNLSQGERVRVERSTKEMVKSGKIKNDKINDVVALFKDMSPTDRVQILTSIGVETTMTGDEFGKLASTDPTKFLMGCAKMVDVDLKDSLKDIAHIGNSALKPEQINTLAAALTRASDTMAEIESRLGKDRLGEYDLIGALSNSKLTPAECAGIAAALQDTAKVEKIFYAPGQVDLSYINPATKDQANAIVNNINVNSNYTIPSSGNPMENSELMNLISAFAGYREILSPDIMRQIVGNVAREEFMKYADEQNIVDAELNEMLQEMKNNWEKKFDDLQESVKTGNIKEGLTSHEIEMMMNELKKNIKK